MGTVNAVGQFAIQATSFWSSSTDVLGIAVGFLLLFLFAWYLGRGRFVALIISLYVGYALYIAFPFLSSLPSAPATTAFGSHLALYLALSLVGYLVLRRTVASEFVFYGVVSLVLLVILTECFLLALLFSLFTIEQVHVFTPIVSGLFSPASDFYIWFAAPLVGLFLLAR